MAASDIAAEYGGLPIGSKGMAVPTGPVDERRSGLEFLGSLSGFEHTGDVAVRSTATIRAILAALGNPHRNFRVVHITGTNGKGSTTAMVAALLQGQGLRVGTYTSPHLSNASERVQIDGVAITSTELDHALEQVALATAKSGVAPSWFEAMTAMAFWELARREVQVGVIEVGMLGRWDATNVVDGEVAVITNVALDHTNFAGPTRAHIATEKAGIIRRGARVILGERDDELRRIYAAARPARMIEAGVDIDLLRGASGLVTLVTPWGTAGPVRLAMAGSHQCDNALTALAAAEALLDRRIPAEDVLRTLGNVCVPGRLEFVNRDPVVLVDGAHNPAAARALCRALGEVLPSGSPRAFVLGALAGHEPEGIVAELGLRQGDFVLATEPDTPRAVPARQLARLAARYSVRCSVVADIPTAVRVAMDTVGPAGSVVVTGSLRVVAAAREELLGRVVGA